MSDRTALHVVRPDTSAHPHEHAQGRSYAPLLALYAAAVGISSAGLVLTGRKLPERPDPRDLALLGVACHTITRVVARSPLAGPLRSRFPASAGGRRGGVGQVLSCPRCLSIWGATGFSFAVLQAPRQTRLAASILATMAVADTLHAASERMERVGEPQAQNA